MAAWLGLIGFSASQGHVLPVIVGAAVSLALSALVKAMFYSDEAGRPYDFSLTPEEQRGMALAARLTSALTAKLGLPGPKQFKVDPTISGLNAGAAGSPQDYALILSPSVLGLPADQMEGVLAHELGHVWHRDSAFVKLNVFLAPLAPILALACGHGAGFAAMTAAAFVTWGAAIRITEYHADEFAARVQGSGRPLGDFFRRYGADIREHAKSLEKQDDSFYAKQGALAYRAYKIKRIFSKLGALPLLLLAAAVKSHPSPERRAARIERLEK